MHEKQNETNKQFLYKYFQLLRGISQNEWVCCCCLKGNPLRISHKQDWSQGFILLLSPTAVFPQSDGDNDGAERVLAFVIQKCKRSCSMWCLMYGGRC